MRKLFPALLAGAVLATAACSDDDGADALAAPQLSVRLTDAPADYDAVVVEVVDVQLRFGDGEATSAPEVYSGSYDLLELSNGIDTLIAAGEVPAGTLQEIRLVLGDGNYLVVDSNQYALSTPSAQQSGLKIKLDGTELAPGRAYELLLDFDAGRSVVEAGGSGKYNLKPVIRATLSEIDDPENARITGVLAPGERQYVFAYQTGGDTLGTYADTLGAFAIVDVPAGIYTVEVAPTDSATAPLAQVTDVLVVQGEVTDVGTIQLD